MVLVPGFCFLVSASFSRIMLILVDDTHSCKKEAHSTSQTKMHTIN